jgi:hypothetical protein
MAAKNMLSRAAQFLLNTSSSLAKHIIVAAKENVIPVGWRTARFCTYRSKK